MSDDARARDALWQGIRVMLDRLEEAGVDPMLVADALLLGTRAHGQMLLADVRPLVESAGWEMPPLVENAVAHGVVTAASFTFYAQRLAERMQLEVVAVPIDADDVAVAQAVQPLYDRRWAARNAGPPTGGHVEPAQLGEERAAGPVPDRWHVEVIEGDPHNPDEVRMRGLFDSWTHNETAEGGQMVCRLGRRVVRIDYQGAPLSGHIDVRWRRDVPGAAWSGFLASRVTVTESTEAA